jgi:E3 SUMO-protein ligase NSE2
MPSRSRESASTPGTQGRVPGVPTIPTYESLGYPLKPDGINALERLQRQTLNGNIKYLDEQLKSSIALLTECADHINDLATERLGEGSRGQSASQEADDGGNENLTERVEAITRRMDEHVRKTIDNAQEVNDVKTGLGKILADSRQQLSLSIAQSQRQQMNNNENGDVENSRIESSQISEPASAPSVSFNKHVTTARDEYQILSLRVRYSEHNDYKSFKAAVFEAQHGPEAELPNPSTWFDNDRASPAPGTAAVDGGANSDDDIQAIRVRTSTKCPLSLAEMSNPVRNKSCNHVFEQSAIEAYIKSVDTARRGPRNVKTCPVPGCEKHIRLDQLYVDALLVRKIQRIQKAREIEQTQAMEMDEELSGEDTMDED